MALPRLAENRERNYQSFWNEGMLGDYCWILIRRRGPNQYKHLMSDFLLNKIGHYSRKQLKIAT